VRKMAWRVLPFLLLTYLVCLIDRLNVGFAALTMNQELGFTATGLRLGRGPVLLWLFPRRSAEQPDHVEGRCAHLVRPHHAQLGDFRRRHGL